VTKARSATARSTASGSVRDHRTFPVQDVPVARIRPEEGLGRKRDRAGHRDLQRSIEQFGVLTPITVRSAPDSSGDYLLIKGQGRALACRLLGIETIPAVVVDDSYAETEKVQQFLVENVARLKMRPVDRALLIKRARQDGEETTTIAQRFGVSASTVRRLLAQLDGASTHEVDVLRSGGVSLGMHAVVTRHVKVSERAGILDIVSSSSITAKEAETLFVALGWQRLTDLGDEHAAQRIVLFHWACCLLDQLPQGTHRERLCQLAHAFPSAFERQGDDYSVVVK